MHGTHQHPFVHHPHIRRLLLSLPVLCLSERPASPRLLHRPPLVCLSLCLFLSPPPPPLFPPKHSYLWSDVMSADGFMAFVEAGTSDEGEMRRLGRLFRDTFLALGGSVAPDEVFRRFRGRDPQVKEVIKYNELDNSH